MRYSSSTFGHRGVFPGSAWRDVVGYLVLLSSLVLVLASGEKKSTTLIVPIKKTRRRTRESQPDLVVDLKYKLCFPQTDISSLDSYKLRCTNAFIVPGNSDKLL